MTRHRDSVKSKCYDAEGTFLRASPRFETWEGLLGFAHGVLRGAVVKRLRPGLTPENTTFKGAAGCNAHYQRRLVHLAHWGWVQGMVLHEIAHLLVDPIYHAGHGKKWRWVYYELAYAHGPKDSYKLLRQGFKLRGLTYTQPRTKRTLTPADRVRLTARLLAGKK